MKKILIAFFLILPGTHYSSATVCTPPDYKNIYIAEFKDSKIINGYILQSRRGKETFDSPFNLNFLSPKISEGTCSTYYEFLDEQNNALDRLSSVFKEESVSQPIDTSNGFYSIGPGSYESECVSKKEHYCRGPLKKLNISEEEFLNKKQKLQESYQKYKESKQRYYFVSNVFSLFILILAILIVIAIVRKISKFTKTIIKK